MWKGTEVKSFSNVSSFNSYNFDHKQLSCVLTELDGTCNFVETHTIL